MSFERSAGNKNFLYSDICTHYNVAKQNHSVCIDLFASGAIPNKNPESPVTTCGHFLKQAEQIFYLGQFIPDLKNHWHQRLNGLEA
jgi:hypothetical protein